jgi:hypothetical protein
MSLISKRGTSVSSLDMGFELEGRLAERLRRAGHEVIDFGNDGLDLVGVLRNT